MAKSPKRFITATVTIPANSPAATVKDMNIQYDPLDSADTKRQVPIGENWAIVDMFVKSTSDVGVDGFVHIIRNDSNVPLSVGPVSTLLVSNPSRPSIGTPIALPAGTQWRLRYITSAAVGASAVNVTLTLVVDVF